MATIEIISKSGSRKAESDTARIDSLPSSHQNCGCCQCGSELARGGAPVAALNGEARGAEIVDPPSTPASHAIPYDGEIHRNRYYSGCGPVGDGLRVGNKQTRNLMIPAQCRAARSVLRWSEEDLSRLAGVSEQLIRDFEGYRAVLPLTEMERLVGAFEDSGMTLLYDGDGIGCGLRWPWDIREEDNSRELLEKRHPSGAVH